MRQVEAAHRGRRRHGAVFGQVQGDGLLHAEQVKEDALLAVVWAGRVARRRTNASILLGFLVIPVVASLSEEALSSVPRELRDASYALGATRWETVRRVVIPHALSGITAASLLGVMRALGETMVVLMAAGGAAIIPLMLTDPVRPLTATIAAEMGETPVGSTHYHALFFAGLILLAVTLAINLASFYIERRKR